MQGKDNHGGRAMPALTPSERTNNARAAGGGDGGSCSNRVENVTEIAFFGRKKYLLPKQIVSADIDCVGRKADIS